MIPEKLEPGFRNRDEKLNMGSVKIPELTSLPEILNEPVFDRYRKGGYLSCSKAGQIRENGQKTVFDV